MVQAAEGEFVYAFRIRLTMEVKFSIVHHMGGIDHLTVKPLGAFRYGLGTDFHKCANAMRINTIFFIIRTFFYLESTPTCGFLPNGRLEITTFVPVASFAN